MHLAWTSEETSGEDRMTVAYLMDTVVQAGYEAIELVVEDIVLDDGDGRFYDQQGRHLDVVFKLYPWEWLIEDEFGAAVLADAARPGGTTWVEPAYKMLWSTKALLPVLWQLFGTDPVLGQYLLPAYFADEMPSSWREYVRKPLWGREGANVAIVRDGEVVEELPGRYGTEGFVRPGVRAAAGLPRGRRPAPPGAGRLGGRRRAGRARHPGERRADHRQPQLLRAAHHRLPSPRAPAGGADLGSGHAAGG